MMAIFLKEFKFNINFKCKYIFSSIGFVKHKTIKIELLNVFAVKV